MDFRKAVDHDLADLAELAARVTDVVGNEFRLSSPLTRPTGSPLEQERRLDEMAWDVRKQWLRVAHLPADASPKSPQAGQHARVLDREKALSRPLIEVRHCHLPAKNERHHARKEPEHDKRATQNFDPTGRRCRSSP